MGHGTSQHDRIVMDTDAVDGLTGINGWPSVITNSTMISCIDMVVDFLPNENVKSGNIHGTNLCTDSTDVLTRTLHTDGGFMHSRTSTNTCTTK